MPATFPSGDSHKMMSGIERNSPWTYDFPHLVGLSRSIQLICCIVQVLMIYSESGVLSPVTFLVYLALCTMNLIHIAKRWYNNIDGRFDLHQLIRERENTLRIQYALALFTPFVLAFIVYYGVELQNAFVASLFFLATVIQLLLAGCQLGLEFFEVLVKGN